jgi:hypothetical protein
MFKKNYENYFSNLIQNENFPFRQLAKAQLCFCDSAKAIMMEVTLKERGS